MKRVKFIDLSANLWLYIPLIIISGLFPTSALFDIYDGVLSEQVVKWITASCYLVFPLYVGRMMIYRNVVQHNTKGITIRINSFWGVNFAYANVDNIYYSADEFVVHKDNGKAKVIDLNGVNQESKDRLLQLLRANVA